MNGESTYVMFSPIGDFFYLLNNVVFGESGGSTTSPMKLAYYVSKGPRNGLMGFWDAVKLFAKPILCFYSLYPDHKFSWAQLDRMSSYQDTAPESLGNRKYMRRTNIQIWVDSFLGTVPPSLGWIFSCEEHCKSLCFDCCSLCFKTIEDFILLVGTLVAFIAFILWCCFPVTPKNVPVPTLQSGGLQ